MQLTYIHTHENQQRILFLQIHNNNIWNTTVQRTKWNTSWVSERDEERVGLRGNKYSLTTCAIKILCASFSSTVIHCVSKYNTRTVIFHSFLITLFIWKKTKQRRKTI